MAWEHIVMSGGVGTLRDPFHELTKATGFSFYTSEDGAEPAEWFPVIMELGVSARDFANGKWGAVDTPADWEQWLQVPSIYRHPPAGIGNASFCTATVKQKFFQQLGFDSSLRRTVRRFELCLPLNVSTDSTSGFSPIPVAALPPDAVVTGIIDDGLAFAHQQFRLPDGKTRVEYFWDQADPSNVSPGLGYGREIRKRAPVGTPTLDSYIASATHAGLIDEDEVYRNAGQLNYAKSGHKSLGQRRAHGTHVMHAACAVDPGVDPQSRPIVCVQFPSRAVADTSGASAARHILDGLVYILKRAGAIAKQRNCLPLPVVVNVSFGNIAGPHDGTSILEAAIDEIVTLRNSVPLPRMPLAVVLPSGNAHLARCHTKFRLKTAGSMRALDWCVQPDDATPSLMQVWLPHQGSMPAAPRVAVKITPPGGAPSPWIEVGETHVWRAGADVLCAATNLSAAQTGSRGVVYIWLAPTVTQRANRNVAPSGEWRVVVKRRNAGPGYWVHAWIQRDDRPHGYPLRGRQSYLEDVKYERFDPASGREREADTPSSHVKRDSSMSAFGTGTQAIVIGGFRGSDFAAWKCSAGGPIVKQAGDAVPHRDGPDALATSDDAPGLPGRLAAGTRSGSIVAMNGTSVAAPQVTQWIANEMGRWLATSMLSAPAIDRNAVKALAQGQEAGPPVRPPPPPLKRAGAGRIKLPPLVDRGIETK